MRLGSTEILVIVVLAILIFGGSRIAGLGKSLGKSIRDFKGEMREEKKEAAAAKAEEAKVTEAVEADQDKAEEK